MTRTPIVWTLRQMSVNNYFSVVEGSSDGLLETHSQSDPPIRPRKLIFHTLGELCSDVGVISLSGMFLTELDVSDYFFEFNESHFPLSLLLMHNVIRTIPRTLFFGYIQETLVELNLSHNQIRSLPVEIGLLRQLKELHLSSNLLESLPQSLANLVDLEIMDISNNRLRSVPLEILRNLSKLRQFFVGNNQFNVMDTKRSRQSFIARLVQLSMHVVGQTLSKSHHFYCTSHGTQAECTRLPVIVQEAMDIATPRLLCTQCSQQIFYHPNEPVLQQLSVVIKCDQPIVAQSFFCSQGHQRLFLSSQQSFRS